MYKETRDKLIQWVSVILYRHIKYAEDNIPRPTAGASLFKDEDYNLPSYRLYTHHGFCPTMPSYVYSVEKLPWEDTEASIVQI